MCGMSLKNRIASADLNGRLGIEGVADIVRRGRLRWFGHLERKGRDDWVSTCRSFEVAGPKSKGSNRRTWGECVKHDLESLNLKEEWAQDRIEWRAHLDGTVQPVLSMKKRTLSR